MFELTRDKVRTNQLVSVGAAAFSFVCCTAVLLSAAWVRTVPRARNFLDRVSFRLLLCCLFWEIIYDINYISVVLGAKPNAACSVGIYFMIGTLGVVNYLCTCIAVNLFVTIVLGLNPVRMGLERWYIAISLFIGFFVPIVPAALGHFGWDPIFHVCWIRAASEDRRITNFVLDLYLWQLLSCAIATAAVAITLWKLFQQGRATSRALFGGDSLNFDMSSDSTEGVKESRRKRFFRGRRTSVQRERMFGHLEDRFISIAIRVSLYPITLTIVNGVIAIGDLYISLQGGVHSKAVYGLYCVYYLFFGIRGVTFAALAAFVDPCLAKGLKAAWAEKFPDSQKVGDERKDLSWSLPEPVGCVAPLASAADPTMNISHAVDLNQLSIPGAPPAASRGSIDSDSSMDVLQALFASEPPPDMHTGGRFLRSSTYGDEEKRHGFHPHLPHFHPHMPHLHMPNLKHLPWFLRRHLEKEVAEAAEFAAAEGVAEPTPLAPASPAATPASFTNAFTGVPTEAMPAWLEDGADDVVAPEALAAAQATQVAAQAPAPDALALQAALSRVETGRDGRISTDRRSSLPIPPPAAAIQGQQAGRTTTPRRGSLASAAASITMSMSPASSARQSFSYAGSHATPGSQLTSPGMRGSNRTSRQRWRRGSVAEPRTPLHHHGFVAHDPRVRREATMALAERLYEEMEAQL